MLLALDPSSSAIGYAVMRSARDAAEFGVVVPDKKSAGPLERIDSMMKHFDKVLRDALEWGATTVVIETPGRHQAKARGNTGEKSGGGANLMMYALAVGQARQLCQSRFDDVHSISSGAWSRSSKEERNLGVRATFPRYRGFYDPGMDASDAIALGVWWWESHDIRALAEEATR